MADPFHSKLARVLVNYSLAIQPGDKLNFRSILGSPDHPVLALVYREAVRAGAHVTYAHIPQFAIDLLVREGSEEQLLHLSAHDMAGLEYYDADLRIAVAANTKANSSLDAGKLSLLNQGVAPYWERYLQRAAAKEMRWCYTQLPTTGYAQDAEMALEDYENFYYQAGLLDQDDPVAAWQRVHDDQQRIADFLTAQDEIRITAPGTDLTYRVKGRRWMNADGKVNFPDGEVFTGPLENSVNGQVSFTYPAIYAGREAEGVRLIFKDGKCVEAAADRGQDYLNAMLDMDEGARYVGEVAFGTNYGITRFTRNLLFDEKIGGTMHMALGASYPETGGVNKSGLHWDMVCDLREGKVYADGKLCYDSGKFVI